MSTPTLARSASWIRMTRPRWPSGPPRATPILSGYRDMASQFSDMLSYFNMSCDPFSHDLDQANLLRLPGIEDSLSSLGIFCDRRGIGVLVGKSGSGKSCLIRLLVAGLPVGLYKPVYLCHSTVSLSEFYGHLAAAFNLPVRGRRASLFRAIRDHVL